uniref:Uncharacterized protein n=1 Tax=Candidatus Kentrum eta TaxID=2126337 RepID=A0A450VDX3_9GAMM|nr:MAG: hypothetical protein BECKH772B_GA0070898_103194 [Candidatus Kentron sp. H]VFK03302.1 MAG: hypothetical protein BECKH772A_GA0070896_103164 [Candidatus Kentron sp. H]VFK05939.1 MAG: hypothetical protein BECKH772C_GA0070978_103144 [Candidatus Kentron sp. H]
MDNAIICLWTHPRSISTAFERVMIERGDLKVLHEPFSYLYYFEKKMAEAVACRYSENLKQPRQYEKIKEYILELSKDKPVFLKICAIIVTTI